MDALLPAISGLVQLCGLLLVIAEIVAAQRLVKDYVHRGLFTVTSVPVPTVADLERLRGFAGEGQSVKWRYDSDTQRLLFVRPLFRFTLGERGVPVGYVDYGAPERPTVHFHPTPLSLWPVFFAFSCLGSLYFVVIEGEWMGGLVPVATLVFIGGIFMIFLMNARRTLDTVVLPELFEHLREWLESA